MGGNVSYTSPTILDSTSTTSLENSEGLAFGHGQKLETEATPASDDRYEAQLREAATQEDRQTEHTTTVLQTPITSDVSTNGDIPLFRELAPATNAEVSNISAIIPSKSPTSRQGSPPPSRPGPATLSPFSTTGLAGGRLTAFLERSRRVTRLRIRTAERRRKSLIHRRTLKERLHHFRVLRSGKSVDDDDNSEEPLDVLWDRVDANEVALDKDDEELAIEEEKILRLTDSILAEKPQHKSGSITRDHLDIKGDDGLSETDLFVDDEDDIDAHAREIHQANQEESQIEDEILRLTHEQVLLTTKAFDEPESEHAVGTPSATLDELDEQRESLNKRLAAVRLRREELLERAETAPPLEDAAFQPAFGISAAQPVSQTSRRGSVTARTSPVSDRDKTTLRVYANSDPNPR